MNENKRKEAGAGPFLKKETLQNLLTYLFWSKRDDRPCLWNDKPTAAANELVVFCHLTASVASLINALRSKIMSAESDFLVIYLGS